MKKILSIFIALSFLIAEINEFEAVFNKQLQKQLARALEHSGFTNLGSNEYVRDGYEKATFKFSEIKAVQGGVGLFNPVFTSDNGHEKTHAQFKLIKINIPISQFIDNLEQIQNDEMPEEINSFSIILEGMNIALEETARDRWIEEEEYYDENWNYSYDFGEEFYDSNGNGKRDEGYWEENRDEIFLSLDYTFDKIIFSFKGYLTKEIFENLEYGVLPKNNQIIDFSINGMRVNNYILGGVDFLNLYSSSGSTKDMWSLNDLKVKFGFLPENNKLRFLINSSAPIGSLNCEFSSDVQFNYNDFELSNFGVVEGSLSADYNLPYNTTFSIDEYMKALSGLGLSMDDFSYGEMTLPSNSSVKSSFYSPDLLNFMISLENGPPNPYLLKDLLSSLRFNYDISMNKFGYDFMGTTLPQELNVSFDEFIFKNFRFNVGLNNGSLSLDVDAPTNIFDFNFKSNVDLMSMFPYNMYDESDMRPPFISNTTISVSNIHSDLEQYIREIEYNIGEQFPRQYGNIVLNISGTLDNPSIQGMNFPNQQPQKRY